MIVHNCAKDDRENCCLSIFDCHISVTGDLALSEKKGKNHCFVLFLSEHDMKEIFAGMKMSQEYYHSIICQTAKTLLQDHDTQD